MQRIKTYLRLGGATWFLLSGIIPLFSAFTISILFAPRLVALNLHYFVNVILDLIILLVPNLIISFALFRKLRVGWLLGLLYSVFLGVVLYILFRQADRQIPPLLVNWVTISLILCVTGTIFQIYSNRFYHSLAS
jgi:hypothetical protein